MSTLTFYKKNMPVTRLNGESSLPPLGELSIRAGRTVEDTRIDEDDELFTDFGNPYSTYPYRDQNMYSRELCDDGLEMAVLENEWLRAEFAPSVGGKLWSLYDKAAGRELLFANPVMRPGNLASRNAWTSGGVEWNCGPRGHHPHTCSWLHTAVTKLDDGTPVLRMYQFERLHAATYQMDFFLPDGSKVLLCRMRIVNDNRYTIPMYWWSNIAVPETPGGRVVMDTDITYTNKGGGLSKVPVPVVDGVDITYPMNNPTAIDFFWKLPPEARRYECQLGPDGYGLIQASTKRLKGRKLFVWGQGPGGDRWQNFLSADDCAGRYVEIQAGLGCTQMECLPMPPKTAWEWLEAYGAMQADPEKVHGEWDGARAEVGARLEELIPAETMEKLLADTRPMAKSKADRKVYDGGGYGALENLRRSVEGEPAICPHLDFGTTEDEQAAWVSLLESATFGEQDPNAVPASWMNQREWVRLIEESVKGADMYNWYAWLQLGMLRLSELNLRDAKEALDRSMTLAPSAWALWGLAQIEGLHGHKKERALMLMRASLMKPDDLSLAKDAVRVLNAEQCFRELLQYTPKLAPEVAGNERIRLNIAQACVETGELERAEALLYADGGISVPDIREGEVSVTELWFRIEEKKAAREGRTFDRETAEPPAALDFRMNAKRKKS